jgi:catechol 2,3-dioxygenase-like lactoylglutathione lyase family enzyme
MFDHLSLGVRDLAAARRFYDALLSPLGHSQTWSQEQEIAYGPEGARLFWLYPVGGVQVAGLGAHVAFRAGTRQAVDAAFEAARANGATILRPAGAHPDIGPDYYGAVLLDPDGNKLEIVLGAMH